MKLKNIPADIRAKSIKEAQNEIKEIITKLEDINVNLEESLQYYNRMLKLNFHIHDQFKQQANKIKQSTLYKSKKSLIYIRLVLNLFYILAVLLTIT